MGWLKFAQVISAVQLSGSPASDFSVMYHPLLRAGALKWQVQNHFSLNYVVL